MPASAACGVASDHAGPTRTSGIAVLSATCSVQGADYRSRRMTGRFSVHVAVAWPSRLPDPTRDGARSTSPPGATSLEAVPSAAHDTGTVIGAFNSTHSGAHDSTRAPPQRPGWCGGLPILRSWVTLASHSRSWASSPSSTTWTSAQLFRWFGAQESLAYLRTTQSIAIIATSCAECML
jgi:hypothetical protein